MEVFVRNAGVLGGLIVVALLLGPLRRRWWLGLAVIGVTVGAALYLDIVPGDTLAGARWESLATLLAWWVLGRLARAAGGPWLPGGLGIGAFLAGALMGDLGAAALVAPLATDGRQAVRAALAASAGALATGIGTPSTVLLLDPEPLLALVLAGVAWPKGQHAPGGSKALTAVLLGAALVALVPGLKLPAIVGAGVVCALFARKDLRAALGAFRLGEAVWMLAAAVLVWAGRAAGTLQQIGMGLDMGTNQEPELAMAGIAGIAALAAALTGEGAAVLLIDGIQATHPWLTHPEVIRTAAVAAAVGGLGPVLLAGRVRDALVPWGLQLVVLLGWAVLVA